MTIFKKAAVEGAGLGAVVQPWEPMDAGAMQTVGARSLDALAAKFDPDKEYTKAQALELIRRVMRTPSYDHASVNAVYDSLLALGGLVSTEWRLGSRKVKRGDISTSRQRRKATRTQYENVMNETGDWVACPRSEAPAMRRRVALFQLDLEDQRAAQLAEQRRLLRGQVEEDAKS